MNWEEVASVGSSPLAYNPTGTAFDDVTQFIATVFAWAPEALPYMRVVHGICHLNDLTWSHAWVEEQRTAETIIYHPVNFRFQLRFAECQRKYFYDSFRVNDVTKYTFEDLVALSIKNDSKGPWEERYRKLCTDGAVE